MVILIFEMTGILSEVCGTACRSKSVMKQWLLCQVLLFASPCVAHRVHCGTMAKVKGQTEEILSTVGL